jgi:hypothetical protein
VRAARCGQVLGVAQYLHHSARDAVGVVVKHVIVVVFRVDVDGGRSGRNIGWLLMAAGCHWLAAAMKHPC